MANEFYPWLGLHRHLDWCWWFVDEDDWYVVIDNS